MGPLRDEVRQDCGAGSSSNSNSWLSSMIKTQVLAVIQQHAGITAASGTRMEPQQQMTRHLVVALSCSSGFAGNDAW
jgi:hypothetical protein